MTFLAADFADFTEAELLKINNQIIKGKPFAKSV
ncbi:MAG: hypothetical protein K0S32_3635 [Bacteroidetes bacterium]|jgi:hypothetical protein|nr:hypothetical protein [Bacteroidota bacterium]